MPSVPKLLKRLSSRNIRRSSSTEDEAPPPMPELSKDLRRGMTLPFAVAGLTLQDVTSSETSSQRTVSSGTNVHPSAQPETQTRDRPVAAEKAVALANAESKSLAVIATGNTMADLWGSVTDAQDEKNLSKAEKYVNKASDLIGGAVAGAETANGAVGFIQSVVQNEEVQAIGKTILEGIPALMGALEELSKVHPFLAAAYLPFRFIYGQEMKRRDNDQKRKTLFEKIKDTIMVLLELKDVKKDDKTRLTPKGEPLLDRLATVCKGFETDIKECWNVLNAQEKKGLVVKFLKASDWNTKLAEYGVKFDQRRSELQFSLQMQTMTVVQENNDIAKDTRKMVEEMAQMLKAMQTPNERRLEKWFKDNGQSNVSAVLANPSQCVQLLQFEGELGPGMQQSMTEEARIASLRRDYYEDIKVAIQDNMEGFMQRFEMGLDQLKDDLKSSITHEGDRMMRALSGGPHKRIKDKIMYHVWKEQGWKGSAKTRPLVLAIRDYLVERVERSRGEGDLIVASPAPADDDDPDDLAKDLSEPLEDDWIVDFLQVKRLRLLQQAFDNDGSGFTTISEINTFTRSRPEHWSLPRWISYWTVGWQLCATKYCVEIDNIFNQMVLLREKISVEMPVNTTRVSTYINGVWPQVTALTSAFERYDNAPYWLASQYQDLVNSEEETLGNRLNRISYDIDTVDTVSLVTGEDHVEKQIFTILTLILRRHLAKFHLCLEQEIADEELRDDIDTIDNVIKAAWLRFQNLTDLFRSQNVTDMKLAFETLSAGLFRNYFEWQTYNNKNHFRTNQRSNSLMVSEEIMTLDPSPSRDILNHDFSETAEPSSSGPEDETDDSTSSSTLTTDSLISGDWYGFEYTEDHKPSSPMRRFTLQAQTSYFPAYIQPDNGITVPEDDEGVKIILEGRQNLYTGYHSEIIDGDIILPRGPDASIDHLEISFTVVNEIGVEVTYSGTLSQDTIDGTITVGLNSSQDFSFFLKRTNSPETMCYRPLSEKLGIQERWSIVRQSVSRRGLLALLDIKRCFELTHKYDRGDISPDDKKMLVALWKSFTFEQYRNIYTVYQWYMLTADRQPQFLVCSVCGSPIRRSRVICIDCRPDDGGLLDLCPKARCVGQHDRKHLLLKVRNPLLMNQYFDLFENAKRCYELASKQSDGEMHCLVCKQGISAPCWYCLECTAMDAFVCDSCEELVESVFPWTLVARYRKEVSAGSDKHNVFHNLVRFRARDPHVDVSALVTVGPSMNDLHELVEKRLVDMEVRLTERIENMIEKRLDEMEGHMVSRMEEMLTRVLSRSQ